jgi:DNA-binding transcriptional LysR family regulator
LVAQRVDVAVWLGELQDSSMIARRLAPGRRVICASPDYLHRHGRPETPDDLRRHNCLTYSAARYDNCWRLRKGGATTEVVVSGNLRASSSSVLLSGALAGLGLALLQESTAKLAIAKGELVRLLDDYQVSPTDADVALYAVYAGRHRVSPKIRAFIDFLVTLFQDG